MELGPTPDDGVLLEAVGVRASFFVGSCFFAVSSSMSWFNCAFLDSFSVLVFAFDLGSRRRLFREMERSGEFAERRV